MNRVTARRKKTVREEAKRRESSATSEMSMVGCVSEGRGGRTSSREESEGKRNNSRGSECATAVEAASVQCYGVMCISAPLVLEPYCCAATDRISCSSNTQHDTSFTALSSNDQSASEPGLRSPFFHLAVAPL